MSVAFRAFRLRVKGTRDSGRGPVRHPYAGFVPVGFLFESETLVSPLASFGFPLVSPWFPLGFPLVSFGFPSALVKLHFL